MSPSLINVCTLTFLAHPCGVYQTQTLTY
jgi:hypothetical protein